MQKNERRLSLSEIKNRYGMEKSEMLLAIKNRELKANFHRVWLEWLITIEEFERWKKQREQLLQQ